jgi:hypothetical protein
VAALSDLFSGPLLRVQVDPDAGPWCGFCAAVSNDRLIVVRTPTELVAAAADARGAGLRGLVLSAPASVGGAGLLTEYVGAVRAGVPDLRVVVEHGPPTDLRALGMLAAAGVTDIGIHAGSLDDEVRARSAPGVLPLTGYERAWDEAVRVFGRYRVSTCLVVGAGEHPGDLVTGAARLIARGVHPVVVPYRFTEDCPAETGPGAVEEQPAGVAQQPAVPTEETCPATATAPLVRWIGQAVADMLRAVGAGVAGLDQQPLEEIR